MDYYGTNDWWDYLAHARKAQERPDHKYVARVEVGVKKGKTLYRYFYSQKEYEAYRKNELKGTTKELETVSDEELRKRLKKAKVDMDSVDIDYAWKDDKDNLYVGYTDGGIHYNLLLKPPSKMEKLLDTAKEKVNSLRKKASDFIKKAFNKVTNKKTSDLGKDFVDKILNPESPAKDYKVSEVGVRARSHTYVARVELPNGKHRYFYSGEDYQRYLARQKYQAESPDFMKDVPRQDVVMTDETRAASMAEINEEFDWGNPDRSQNCMYCTTAYELRQRGYDVQAADRGTDDVYKGHVSDLEGFYENPKIVYMSYDGTIKDESYMCEVDNMFQVYYHELKPAYDTAKAKYEELYNKADFLERTIAPSKELKDARAEMERTEKEADTAWDKWMELSQSDEYKAIENDHFDSHATKSRLYSGKEVFDFIKKASEPNSRGNFMVDWYNGGGHSMIYETDKYGNVTIRDSQTNRIYQPSDLDRIVTFMELARTDNLKLKPGILKTVEAN